VTRSDVRRTGRARDAAPHDAAEDATGNPEATAGATATAVTAAPSEAAEAGEAERPIAARWWAGVDPRGWSTRVVAAVIVVLTAGMLLVSYAGKARCVGPTFDDKGRTTPDYDIRIDRDLCYSDIQYLWLDRDIDKHVFPYVHGGITPPPDSKLTGGTVEYPVLTGLLMWVGAFFATNDGEFLLYSALLMAPFGLATGWMLGKLARWRALTWALGPPLFLYAFHNWDLPVVACAVAAVYVVHGWRAELSLRQRATLAAVLLGLGFAFKLYPGAFVAPLMLYVLTASRPGRRDWWGAIGVGLAATATVVLVNLPFALAGYDGWRASFTFQELRKVDLTTNSIWFWGFRPDSEPTNEAFQRWVSWLSPTLVIASFVVAMAVGLWRWRRSGSYPWIAVSAAMLCGFLLLHKVHSPQYTLWLVPFFVLLAVPWRWVFAYMVVDICMDVGVFRWFYAMKLHGNDIGSSVSAGLAAQLVALGVWGRAALLAVLFVVVLVGPDRLAAQGTPSKPEAVPAA
jgi:Glycosyltransferase family 87